MSLVTCLIVMLGGAPGTLSHFLVSLWALPISCNLPWGTILINITGSCVIGFFGAFTLAHGRFPVSENVRLFELVGLCGGNTTLSAFSLQTLDLLRGGEIERAAINMVASAALCVAAVALGHVAAAQMNGGAVRIARIAIEEEA